MTDLLDHGGVNHLHPTPLQFQTGSTTVRKVCFLHLPEDPRRTENLCSEVFRRQNCSMCSHTSLFMEELDLPLSFGTNVDWITSTWLGWIACYMRISCEINIGQERLVRNVTFPVKPSRRPSSHSSQRYSRSL